MKPKPDFSDGIRPLKPATKEQIAALAHELWLAQGSPSGSDLDIWLEAERMLKGHAPRLHADPIPADPGNVEVDDDPALNGDIERGLREIARPPQRRSPTSL